MEFLKLPNEMHVCILNEINDENAFTTISRLKRTSKYFQYIATENIKVRDLTPKPKFRKGSLVRYTSEWVNECKERIAPLIKKYGGNLGEQPFGRLIIYSEPVWNSQNKMFSYYYEYGMFGDHEGCALEKDLELYSTMFR